MTQEIKHNDEALMSKQALTQDAIATVVAVWFKTPNGVVDVDVRWTAGWPGRDVSATFENFTVNDTALTVKARLPERVPPGNVGCVAAHVSVSEQGVIQQRVQVISVAPGQKHIPSPPTPSVSVDTRPARRRVTFSDGRAATIEGP
jgi:hypothetical protein